LFFKNVLYTFSAEIIMVGINAVVGILLARFLTVLDRGIMFLVMTLPILVYSFLDVGLSQANIYLLKKKEYSPRYVLGNSLAYCLIIGVVAVVSLWLLRAPIQEAVLKGMPAGAYIWLVLLVPVLLLNRMLLSFLRANDRFDLFNLQRLLEGVLLLSGVSVIFFALHGGLSQVIILYFGVMATTTTFALVAVAATMPIEVGMSGEMAKEAFLFGSKIYAHNMLGFLNYRLSMYLLAIYLTPVEVAYYGLATSLGEMVWYIPDSVGLVLFPRLASVENAEVGPLTAKVGRFTMVLTSLIGVGLLSFGWLLIPLVYGADYKASVVPLIVLMPGIMAMGLYKVLIRYFTAQDRQQWMVLAAIVGVLVTIVALIGFLPLWGTNGAAVATALGYMAMALVLSFKFIGETSLGWRDMLLPKLAEVKQQFGVLKDMIVRFRMRKSTEKSTF
jgi:O-antigen/teichoic acid export membrane protein